ncbi:T9SS type B sorting domain-containing protein [Flavivirga eckloniae]|uniref:Ig-like domain-containing protein n=1 Tax=Flavivirga eckloniae TaxID=1803846 RepID=A0A2K9PYT6_9FLAO|nr:gliding motility-associated C-terminal domain-containing protein [Flavivirga eckloniae]AUP81727.1 hypothetical protein C1H87_22530 [Flavivirga eckloniae]
MRNFTITTYIVVVFLLVTGKLCGQMVIQHPLLGEGFSRWEKACASDAFNSYEVIFHFTQAELTASTQFVLELSDNTGDFSSPEILHTSAVGAITASPGKVSVAMPITVSGEGYKIRVRSIGPDATSSPSDAFPAYYKIHNETFTINKSQPTGVFCAGGSYLLTIDNPGEPGNNSPLQFSSLTFNWYKETGPDTKDFIATAPSLEVTTPGTYFVETNYGSCSLGVITSDSNRVTITEAVSVGSSSITSSLGNPYCASLGSTTLTTVSANTYQWYIDGVEISGATEQTYVTDQSGKYSVNITLNGCSTSASIDLDANLFTSSIDVEVSPAVNLIPASGALEVNITDTASSPTYEWYLNGNLITGANGSSFDITEIGSYKAVVSQTVGCESSKEFLFEVTETFPNVEKIPNLISPNGDGTNDTWVIPKTYVSGTNTEVILVSSQGEIVLQTKDYQNNWPQDDLSFKAVNPVYYYIIITEDNKTRKGSITVVK